MYASPEAKVTWGVLLALALDGVLRLLLAVPSGLALSKAASQARSGDCMGVSKNWGPVLGASITRIIVCWGRFWGSTCIETPIPGLYGIHIKGLLGCIYGPWLIGHKSAGIGGPCGVDDYPFRI